MADDVVIYPSAVAEALTFLRPALAARSEEYAAGVVVRGSVPAARPKLPSGELAPLVVLRPAGGGSQVLTVDKPRLDAQVWHRDDFSAQALAQLVRGLLRSMPGEGAVRAVSDFAGPVPLDPESGQARYLLTVELTTRGAKA